MSLGPSPFGLAGTASAPFIAWLRAILEIILCLHGPASALLDVEGSSFCNSMIEGWFGEEWQ